jgi:hypothetical protein
MVHVLFSLRLGRHSFAAIDFADGHCVKVLQPSISRLSQFNVEHASVDNLGHWHLAIVAFNDLGSMVELLDQAADRFATGSVHGIDLVQHDDVCKLDLINHQV